MFNFIKPLFGIGATTNKQSTAASPDSTPRSLTDAAKLFGDTTHSVETGSKAFSDRSNDKRGRSSTELGMGAPNVTDLPSNLSSVETWKRIIVGDERSWVLFENGTCVILVPPESDLRSQATTIMKGWGPVCPGHSSGDFSVLTLSRVRGWVVTCHHKDVITFVAPDEVGANPSDVTIGLLGRMKRNEDAEQLQIVHVEDRRNPTQKE